MFGMAPVERAASVFAIFTVDDIGVPQNPAGVAPGFVDPGLGGFLMNVHAGLIQPVSGGVALWERHRDGGGSTGRAQPHTRARSSEES